MRVITRSLLVGFVAVLGAIVLAVAWTTATAVQLLATTALIMGGANHSLEQGKDSPSFVEEYLDNAVNLYIDPSADAGNGTAGAVDNTVAVTYPAEFFPVFGSKTFDESVADGRDEPQEVPRRRRRLSVATTIPLVQSRRSNGVSAACGRRHRRVRLLAERRGGLAGQTRLDRRATGRATRADRSSIVANPMRGNGGILMRLVHLPSIPFFGITFYGAAPTNSPVDENGNFVYPTVDYAQQYDGLGGDFPYRPLNLLALVNSLLGYAFLHGGVVNKPSSEALFQGKEGDTSYYLFPTEVVPVLMPLQMIGVPKPILSFFDTFLRVVIEDAYLRDVNPGVPTAATLLPIGDPIGLVLKLLAAIPVAIDNALEDLGLGRPLGTTEPGPFGVGGPPLPAPPSALSTTTVSTLAAQTEYVDGDNAESSVLEAQSLMSEQTPEPSADSEPVVDVNEETELVDPDPTTEEQVERPPRRSRPRPPRRSQPRHRRRQTRTSPRCAGRSSSIRRSRSRIRRPTIRTTSATTRRLPTLAPQARTTMTTRTTRTTTRTPPPERRQHLAVRYTV